MEFKIKIEVVNYWKEFADDYTEVYLGRRDNGEIIYINNCQESSNTINNLLEKLSNLKIVDLKIKNYG